LIATTVRVTVVAIFALKRIEPLIARMPRMKKREFGARPHIFHP
jgi:hypothetical protein